MFEESQNRQDAASGLQLMLTATPSPSDAVVMKKSAQSMLQFELDKILTPPM